MLKSLQRFPLLRIKPKVLMRAREANLVSANSTSHSSNYFSRITFPLDWLPFYLLNIPKAFLLQGLCTCLSLCLFFTTWFPQLVSSQASEHILRANVTNSHPPAAHVIHYPLHQVNESITFFITFQAIMRNCNYLVHFLVSLLLCLLPHKHT